MWWGCCEERTVIDLIGLSPLLVDEDDGHQHDHLGHDAKEGPEGGQAAANAQVDLVAGTAQVVAADADVVSDVCLDVQVADGQGCLVGGALDLILVTCAVDEWLKGIVLKEKKKKQVRHCQNA